MHRTNCFCAGRDRRFELVRIQRAADRINIDEHRRGADVTNGPSGCDEAHRDGDDFVSWPDIEAAQSQVQRASAAVQADTMISSATRSKFCLKIYRCAPLGEARRLTNLLQRAQHFTAQAPILLSKVQIRYSFHFS